MRPQFLNVNSGSGKKVSEALNKIFKIVENSRLAELDYIDYKTFELDDFEELKEQLKILDEEFQEGSEWSID